MKNRLYLSGPMKGLPDSNYPAFNAEAARLRALGWHVENPAECQKCDSWEGYMRLAVAQLATCGVIAMLPGWSSSRGACVERDLAEVLGLEITRADWLGVPP
jgi:hypothetical protein